MGGHGALITALKNPGFYKSVSVFSPIANPSNGPWGIKAFTGYFGPKSEEWDKWDATELVKKYNGSPFEVLIDQVTLEALGGSYFFNRIFPRVLEIITTMRAKFCLKIS